MKVNHPVSAPPLRPRRFPRCTLPPGTSTETEGVAARLRQDTHLRRVATAEEQ